MPPTPEQQNYIENERNWIEENNVQPGDYVRITRSAINNENGWRNAWNSLMNGYVGEIHTISGISSTSNGSGIHINGFGFPYFVLEKIIDCIVLLDDREFSVEPTMYNDLRNIYLGE